MNYFFNENQENHMNYRKRVNHYKCMNQSGLNVSESIRKESSYVIINDDQHTLEFI